MRFLIDAQLPPGLARVFEAAGEEAVHVAEVGMLDADDRAIADYALQSDMVVVTKDEDFARAHDLGLPAPPIVWIRIGNTTNRYLSAALAPQLRSVVDALAGGDTLVEVR